MTKDFASRLHLRDNTGLFGITPPSQDIAQRAEAVRGSGSRVWLKQSGVKHFCGDLPEPEQKLVYANTRGTGV